MNTSSACVTPGKVYCAFVAACNATAGFYDSACFRYYLLRLIHFRLLYQVRLHAYTLLPDEIWLLLTPGTPQGVHHLFDTLNRSYSAYFSRRFQREVRVWRATPMLTVMPTPALALECQKYIERMPLRAGEEPGRYPWCSYAANAFGCGEGHLAPHGEFRRFMQSRSRADYRAWIRAEVSPERRDFLESRLRDGIPLVGRRPQSTGGRELSAPSPPTPRDV